jgi:hypothetical protein
MGLFSKKKAQLQNAAQPGTTSPSRSATPINDEGHVRDVEKTQQLDTGKVPFLTARTFVMVNLTRDWKSTLT